MANSRFSISTDPAIQRAIKAHAEAAGLDVSTYLVAAAIAQMAADDAVSAVFASAGCGECLRADESGGDQLACLGRKMMFQLLND
jgi:hypothetical protein